MRTVYIATDLSDGADDAIRRGDALARVHDAALVVGHVVPWSIGLNVLFPTRSIEELEALRATRVRARAAVASRVSAITDRPVDEVDVDLHEGSAPDRAILRGLEARDADVVVLGARGAGGASPHTIGRCAKRVLRAARIPVVIARPSSSVDRRPVVVAATDFSDPARPALRAGADYARRTGGRSVFLHSVAFAATPVLGMGEIGGGVVPVPPSAAVLDGVRQRLIEEAYRIDALDVEVRVDAMTPARAICAAARELGADLVVVGSHGRGALHRFALGSVAETVVTEAPCSVLVVPLARD